MVNSKEKRSSWEGASVYQIYPATFNEHHERDEDYQGIGNFQGMIEKIPYLKDLGVEAVWVSPFYPSPMVDGGYDIADYTNINPSYGTLDDFDKFLAGCHEEDIRLMIDLVPNHTSDQHAWFQESSSSRLNPRRDWYSWADPAPDGGPPNNWTSVFSLPQLRARQEGRLIVPEGENTPGVSAWQFHHATGQYYLRDFAAEQPNLNWHNPEVREAMKDVMRIWLRRGVDGFRVDVANHLGKDPQLRDEAPNPDYIEGVHNPHDQHMHYHSLNYPPTLYPYLRELTSVIHEDEFNHRDLRMVLECWMSDKDLAKIDQVDPSVANSFNFTPLFTEWNAANHSNLLNNYYARLPKEAIGNVVLSNHDVPRVATRLGARAARAAAVSNLSLPRVMTFIYNGEEGGFTNVEVPPARRQDDELGLRDEERTPMLWDASLNAGFSRAHPDKLWLPPDPDYETKNLARQAQDPQSFFSLYRALLHTRRSSQAMRRGEYRPLVTTHENAVAFAGRHENDQTITVINFADTPIETEIHGAQQNLGKKIISSLHVQTNELTDIDRSIKLEPNEAIVFVKTA